MNTETRRIQITLSELINDLDNGLTWLKKDDAGDGSIQDKYGLSERKAHVISQHPKLVGIEPNLLIVEIVDDLKHDNVSTEAATEPAQGISDTGSAAEGRNSTELPLDNSQEVLASNESIEGVTTRATNETATTTSSNTDESKQEEFSNFMSL